MGLDLRRVDLRFGFAEWVMKVVDFMGLGGERK